MPERIRFYLDEHIPKAVAESLRRRGVDVLRAQEAGMMSASDQDHLELATSQGRVIFTQDANFLRLHRLGMHHAGIVYIPQQAALGYIIRNQLLLVDLLNLQEMQDHVELL